MINQFTDRRLYKVKTSSLSLKGLFHNISSAQIGFTLIEMILSMLIISISVTGILTVMNMTISHSADPMINNQAIAIAESYLEEILLKSYIDPDGSEVGETRASYDDVDDYNGLSDSGVVNQQGSSVAGLTDYNVAVTVSTELTLTGNVKAKKVTVDVSGSGVTGISLVGYRSKY